MSRIGRVDTPIELTVTDGRVVGIDGGSEADRLAGRWTNTQAGVGRSASSASV